MSAAPVDNPIVLNLAPGFGSALIGSFLSCAMWGISSLQVFIYFMNYDRDSTAMKAMIGCLWFMDTVNQVLTSVGTWNVLIPQYGNISHLMVVQIEQMHHTWVESIVIFIIQLYFIRRIYVFNKQTRKGNNVAMIFLYTLMFLLALWQLIGILIYQIYGYGRPLAALTTKLEVGINMSLRVAAVACDLAIAVCMVFLLTKSESNNFRSTKRMVHRLILIAVSSGSITAVFVLLVLILLVVFPADLYYLAFEFSLCSLYFSTLLANLNSRDFIRGSDHVSTMSYSTNGAGSTLAMGNMNRNVTGSVTLQGVKVDHSENVTVDGPDVYNFKRV